MSYKAIYTYAWDLADEGVARAVAQFRDLGLDTVTVAGSYHAGKFLRPHGRSGKVYFPEDGTVYFKADARRYGAIKPLPNSMLADRDVIGDLSRTAGIATNVCVESTLRDGYHREYFGIVLADATHQAGPRSLHEGALANIETFFGWVSDVAAFEAALRAQTRAAAE